MNSYISACTIHGARQQLPACEMRRLTPMSGIKFFNGTLREEVLYQRLVVPIDKSGTIRNP